MFCMALVAGDNARGRCHVWLANSMLSLLPMFFLIRKQAGCASAPEQIYIDMDMLMRAFAVGSCLNTYWLSQIWLNLFRTTTHLWCVLQISLTEVQNELVYSASAYGIMGRPGVVLINCIIFMAVTSSGSGEMLAVSSLFTFDFYREYLRPRVSLQPPLGFLALPYSPSPIEVFSRVQRSGM